MILYLFREILMFITFATIKTRVDFCFTAFREIFMLQKTKTNHMDLIRLHMIRS
jgi:hypothetical protein